MAMYPNGTSPNYQQADGRSNGRAELLGRFRQQLGLPPLQERLAHADGRLEQARNAIPQGNISERLSQPAGGFDPGARMQVPDLSGGTGSAALLNTPAPQGNRGGGRGSGGNEDAEPTVYDTPRPDKGRGKGPKALRRALMQLSAQNAKRADPMIWGLIDKLSQRAQTYDPYTLATERAGEFEAINTAMQGAESGLDRMLAERGMTDSSYGGAAYGQLAAQGGAARAGLTRGIMNDARTDQQRAEAQLSDLLNSLQGRHTNTALSTANQILSDRMQQEQLDAQGGFDLGGFLGTLGGLGGAYLGRPRVPQTR